MWRDRERVKRLNCNLRERKAATKNKQAKNEAERIRLLTRKE